MSMPKLTATDVTQEVKSYVNAYLMQRTIAEVTRDKVNTIETEILTECPLMVSDEWSERGRLDGPITDPKHTYLCDKGPELEDYYLETNKRLRDAGIKPDEMPDTHCPALVAEHDLIKIERLLLGAAAVMLKLGIDGKELNQQLMCSGMKQRQKFIDLLVGLVVNMPGYINPLTHKPIEIKLHVAM